MTNLMASSQYHYLMTNKITSTIRCNIHISSKLDKLHISKVLPLVSQSRLGQSKNRDLREIPARRDLRDVGILEMLIQINILYIMSIYEYLV